MAPTPKVFTELFNAAESLTRDVLLPSLDPDGDPDPMLLVQFEEGTKPVLVALPPVHSSAKDFYALVLSAFVQALNPHAVATLMAVWLRSATPNREAIMVSTANRSVSALGMIFIKRNAGAAPSIEEVDPPKVADQEQGRFAGLFDQDVSALPPDLLEQLRSHAARLRLDCGAAERPSEKPSRRH